MKLQVKSLKNLKIEKKFQSLIFIRLEIRTFLVFIKL